MSRVIKTKAGDKGSKQLSRFGRVSIVRHMQYMDPAGYLMVGITLCDIGVVEVGSSVRIPA